MYHYNTRLHFFFLNHQKKIFCPEAAVRHYKGFFVNKTALRKADETKRKNILNTSPQSFHNLNWLNLVLIAIGG
jgi:hypothetical protein